MYFEVSTSVMCRIPEIIKILGMKPVSHEEFKLLRIPLSRKIRK